MTQSDRNRWIGAASTVCVHAAVLLLLWLWVIKSEPVPAEAGGGVLVQFGTVDEATGMFIPDEAPAASSEAVTSPEEPLMTQDVEETVAMPAETTRTKKEESRPQEDNRQRESDAIDNRLKSAFGQGVSSTGSRGDAAQGSGAQGNPFGATGEGALQGVGGYGGYSLGGRGLLGTLPRPEYDNSNDAGTLVVDIVVNAQGKVISARVRVNGSEGSAASNGNLRSRAVAAAREARFEERAGSGNQQGYIVYYFKQQ